MPQVKIIKLNSQYSTELSQMVFADPPDYRQHFTPFSFEAKALNERLKAVQKDQYWGINYADKLVCFFMLRGFDEGYKRPSFGVYVAKPFTNKGLGKLAIQYALSWCRLNNITAVMLKVHPHNTYARHTYQQAGFKFLAVCSKTGHDIFEKQWD